MVSAFMVSEDIFKPKCFGAEELAYFIQFSDEDDYNCNSVNFQARTSRFCIEVYLQNTYNMKLIKMMIMKLMMIMMMKMMRMIIALTQAIFKLGPPDFSRK